MVTTVSASPPFPVARWIEAARRRWRDPAFADARRALEAACAVDAGLPRTPPKRRAGHYHDYFCPEHAVQLSFDPFHETGHACPVDGQRFLGEPFDTARLWLVNNRLSTAAFRFGLRAALEPGGPTAVADRARCWEILAGYLDAFPPVRAADGLSEYPGVIGFSGLDDSVWLVRISWAYGLLAAHLPAADQARFRFGILEPMTSNLLRIRCPPTWPQIDNIAVWNDAALVVTAAVLGDDAELDQALNGPLGLRDQLVQGVQSMGLWWEGSLSYHFYTLAATIWAVRALAAAGRSFADHEIVGRMFQAPLELALPDLSLPAMNDGWYDIGLLGRVGHDIPDAMAFYETANAWYGTPGAAEVVRRNAARRPRMSIELLLDGSGVVADERRPAPRPRETAERAAPSGLAVLSSAPPGSRRLATSRSVVILKAGHSGGGHGHPDQLAIQLYAAGVRMIDDLGTTGYGVALNDSWYRATASHNTFMLDGISQPLANGAVRTWEEGDDAVVAMGNVTWPVQPAESGEADPYAGVQAHRQVALTPSYVVDVLEVDAGRPRVIDWLLLPSGRLESRGMAPLATSLDLGAGYAHIEELRGIPAGATRVRWTIGAGSVLDVHYPPHGPGETVIAGTAPSNPPAARIGFLVRRRRASHARFVSVLAPSARGRRRVRTVSWANDHSPPGEYLLTVTTDRGSDAWELRGGLLHRRAG